MKTYWGVKVQLHTFLTSALDLCANSQLNGGKDRADIKLHYYVSVLYTCYTGSKKSLLLLEAPQNVCMFLYDVLCYPQVTAAKLSDLDSLKYNCQCKITMNTNPVEKYGV
jgi:hypothetical protein